MSQWYSLVLERHCKDFQQATEMAITELIKSQSTRGEQQQEELSQECKELLSTLAKEKGWRTKNLYLFQGFWCQPKEIQAIMSVQNNFKAQETDLVVATIPKSGTTWLKALTFAIVYRNRFCIGNHHPLLKSNPHELVPFLEYKLYADNSTPDLSCLPCPRLFGTHMPLSALPESVHKSNCRLVYVCRNPLDTFVSVWHYLSKIRPESLGPLSIEEAFDMYCNGVIGFGPYWDHMLRYWNASLEKPHKVLFFKYEDMKKDTTSHIKKLAEFVGFPFSQEEEKEGIIQEIIKLCSFEALKNLEVNKKGKGAIANFENKYLFRKGEVGDWINHLTPLMAGRLASVMEEKLAGSNLSFEVL